MSVIEHSGAITERLVRARRVSRVTRPLKPKDGSGLNSEANLPPPQSQARATTHSGALGAIKSANKVIVAALGLGGCVDILFYGKATGISTLVFAVLVLAALFWLALTEGVRPAWRNMWLMGPLLFFAAMVAFRASATLTQVNILTTFALLFLVVAFFAEGKIEQIGLLGYPLEVVRTIKKMFVRPAPLALAMKRSASANHAFNHRAGEIARGALLAVPVLLLFTFLLSSADAVFQGYIADLLKLRFTSDLPEMALRTGIILSASWLAAGALLIVASKRNSSPSPNVATTGRLLARWRGLSFMEAAVVLGLVNALFVVFAWIQFTVLFSGQAARTMGFEEYREYVRRGFGELLVVAVLTMILILGLRRAVRRATEGQEQTLKILNSVMIALALVMLVSAFERMVVWESIQFYINTVTRIFVRTFIIWLGLLFVWLLLTSWLRRDRFAIGAFVAVLGFLATINLINPDADVAAYNIRRNDELSTRYLYLLSEDAVPALAAGLDTTTGEAQNALRIDLSQRYRAMRSELEGQEWQELNFSRQDAYKVLVKLRNERRLFWVANDPTDGVEWRGNRR
jgi:hypothetical protein